MPASKKPLPSLKYGQRLCQYRHIDSAFCARIRVALLVETGEQIHGTAGRERGEGVRQSSRESLRLKGRANV